MAAVEAQGVVLTTYFNSRIDPLRCYKHKVGRQGLPRRGGRRDGTGPDWSLPAALAQPGPTDCSCPLRAKSHCRMLAVCVTCHAKCYTASCARCPCRQGGRIESDALDYMEHWYASVVRLGLPAVLFHESLSPEFVDRVQTGGWAQGAGRGQAWAGGQAGDKWEQ